VPVQVDSASRVVRRALDDAGRGLVDRAILIDRGRILVVELHGGGLWRDLRVTV